MFPVQTESAWQGQSEHEYTASAATSEQNQCYMECERRVQSCFSLWTEFVLEQCIHSVSPVLDFATDPADNYNLPRITLRSADVL